MNLPFDEFVRLCAEWGYEQPTQLPDGRLAAIHRRFFNTLLLVGIDRWGYQDAF